MLLRLAAALVTSLAAGPVAVVQAQTVPTGFVIQSVVGDPLAQPIGFAFLPDGRIVLIEKETGNVRLAPAVGGGSTVVHTIPNVAIGPERGLLGLAVDPGWPARPYLYFHFTHTSSNTHLVMYTATGDLSDPTSTALALGSPFLLVDDIPDLAFNHNGGTLRFGPDGFLYASIGDDGQACDAQDRTLLAGKILRLDVAEMPQPGPGPPPRSAITPASNPFLGADPDERLVFAYGFRNPYRFSIDPWTNDLYIGDVGLETWEEVDEITYAGYAGQNFGWPEFEGPLQDPDPNAADCSLGPFTAPIYWYPNPPGGPVASVVGGPLYRPNPLSSLSFPRAYNGDLFVCEFYARWMRRLTRGPGGWVLADPVPGQPNATDWATNLGSLGDVQVGPDGALYVLVLFPAGGTLARGLHRIVNTLPSDAGDAASAATVTCFAPNPLRAGRAGAWRLVRPATERVLVRVFDARGRLVRALGSPANGATPEIHWDGRTAAGEASPPGLYLYEVTSPGGPPLRGKLAIVR